MAGEVYHQIWILPDATVVDTGKLGHHGYLVKYPSRFGLKKFGDTTFHMRDAYKSAMLKRAIRVTLINDPWRGSADGVRYHGGVQGDFTNNPSLLDRLDGAIRDEGWEKYQLVVNDMDGKHIKTIDMLAENPRRRSMKTEGYPHGTWFDWYSDIGRYEITPYAGRHGGRTKGYVVTLDRRLLADVRTAPAARRRVLAHYAAATGCARNPLPDWHEDRYRTLVRERLSAETAAHEAQTDGARRSHALHAAYLTGKVDEEAVALGQYPRRRQPARNPGYDEEVKAGKMIDLLPQAVVDRVIGGLYVESNMQALSVLMKDKEAAALLRHMKSEGKFAKLNPGKKRRSRKTAVKRNPGTDMGSLMKHPGFRKALKLYRQIHGCDPKSVKRVILPVGDEKKITSTDFFVSLGKAPADSYEPNDRQSQKYGKIWVHPYDHKPIKAVDKTGKFIVTLPGSHRVKAGADGEAWIHGN